MPQPIQSVADFFDVDELLIDAIESKREIVESETSMRAFSLPQIFREAPLIFQQRMRVRRLCAAFATLEVALQTGIFYLESNLSRHPVQPISPHLVRRFVLSNEDVLRENITNVAARFLLRYVDEGQRVKESVPEMDLSFGEISEIFVLVDGLIRGNLVDVIGLKDAWSETNEARRSNLLLHRAALLRLALVRNRRPVGKSDFELFVRNWYQLTRLNPNLGKWPFGATLDATRDCVLPFFTGSFGLLGTKVRYGWNRETEGSGSDFDRFLSALKSLDQLRPQRSGALREVVLWARGTDRSVPS